MPDKPRPTTFLNLVEVLRRLRAPGGCPWDREQTTESLKPFLLEETYEVLEALDHGDPEAVCEELGDLLLQVVFLSQIFEEQGEFTVEDVARGITEKLIRRHPHVFSGTSYTSMDELNRQWERIKRSEKKHPSNAQPTSRIPKSLPALARGQKIAAKQPRNKSDHLSLARQFFAHRDGIQPELRERHLGQALYRLVLLGHNWGIDSEQALRRFLDEQEQTLGVNHAKTGDS
jgi:tetrapyrrole methylase family protein / MazG family protein